MKSPIGLIWPRACRTNADSRFAAGNVFWLLLFSGRESPAPRQPEFPAEEAASAGPPPETPGAEGNGAAGELLPKRELAQLCTALFRMERNLVQLDGQESSRQTRGIARNCGKLKETLDGWGVTYKDISGEGFNSGRKDIEVIAADDSSRVTQPVIDICETPVVMLNGKVIQKAKGTVLRPAGECLRSDSDEPVHGIRS